MTTPAGLERKVRELDNDVQSIYEMLAGISATQQRQGNRLNEIDAKLDEMGDRLGTVDGRLDRVESRLDGVDGKLDTIIGLLGEGRPASAP